MIQRTIPLYIAVGSGVLTLVGLLFVPALATLLLGWVSLLVALALVMGILNLTRVHVSRFVSGQNAYSLVLLLGLLIPLGAGFFDRLEITSNALGVVFAQILFPLEAALGALTSFFILFAGYRLLQRERTLPALLFIATALIVLLASAPLPGALANTIGPLLQSVHDFLQQVVVQAGVRGLLIGIALGAVTAGLRLLAGFDRPYAR